MADRLARASRDAGLDAASTALVVATFDEVLKGRPIRDAHDPAFLHPARNALILLVDLRVDDPVEIRAAIHCDSTRPRDHPPADPAVRAMLDAVPLPDHDVDRLLEELIVAGPALRRIALADRLDHARHLHLMPPGTWHDFHSRIRQAYLPAAERTHPMLARRLGWWTDMFARRWLPAART
jgi:hypothetical protein